jgi:hypothetical protein
MEQEQLLKEIGRILKVLDVPYIITGGIAVTVWGRPRFTADIDIVVELLLKHVDDLIREFSRIKDGFIDEQMIRDALKQEGEFNFLHSVSGLKVDFWILKNDAFDKSRIKRRIRKTVAGQELYFTSPEDLILIKLLWYKESQSTRHLEDIESVLRIQKKLDYGYIRKWSKVQGTLSILNQLINHVRAVYE